MGLFEHVSFMSILQHLMALKILCYIMLNCGRSVVCGIRDKASPGKVFHQSHISKKNSYIFPF